ncbi:hypothetical protein ABZX90_05825 [Streptomyces sp. NPDC002935]|uniref:hypothetical protein n=1 Tax=Streptomyces sp. NPDC002935 TaxID=3154545 RepID=UPI0033BE657E
MAAWMLAGLFMGLTPTIIENILHLHSGLLNGARPSSSPPPQPRQVCFLCRPSLRRTVVVGTASVLLGTAVITAGVAVGALALLWLGGVIGFGASFSGAIRTIAPLAAPHERAGLFAAVHMVACLSFGIPTTIAGLLITYAGLPATVLGTASRSSPSRLSDCSRSATPTRGADPARVARPWHFPHLFR